MGSSRTSPDLGATSAAAWLLDRAPPTLERMVTHPDYFALTTASPVQRATCRAIEGRPFAELEHDPIVRAAIGDVPILERPREAYILSGSRVGKTLISAAIAVLATQTVDVSALGPGDEPRIPILSLDTDKAHACFLHLTGALRERAALRHLVIREGRNELDAPAVWLRHPSGRAIMVCVAAGKAAGNAVVSYFLAGAIFDEWCKMHGSSEKVVNFEDSRHNALPRLLPGAQLVGIGSPWAPFGPAYNTVKKYWRAPADGVLVVRARGRDMNPSWWTPARIASLPANVLRTDEEAEFLVAEEQFLETIDACIRRDPVDLPPEPGRDYVAAMDPATRGNAWTLVVTTRVGDKRVVVLVREWRGSPGQPLEPEDVFEEIAGVLAPYGISDVETDQWATDALRSGAARAGLTLVEWPASSTSNVEMYLEMKRLFESKLVELPPVPQLREDLVRLRKRVTQIGVQIVLPKTTDGRHCDFAPSLARTLRRYLEDAKGAPPPLGTNEHVALEQKRTFDAVRRRYGAGANVRTPWWKR